MKKNAIIVKSNKLIEAKYKLTLQEQKLILTMLSMIKPTDDEFQEYNITAQELSELWGVSVEHIYKEADEVTDRLHKRFVTLKDPNKEKFIKYSWLSKSIYHNGVLTLKFNSELKPHLLQLSEKFKSYKLEQVLKLKSGYSIRIYELLKQYENIGSRTLNINELRNILDIAIDEYKLYSDFKRKVIQQAQKELQNSDLQFDFEEIKNGRKVVEIRFIINHSVEEEPKYLKTKLSFVAYMRKNFVNKNIAESINPTSKGKKIVVSIASNGKIYDKNGEEFNASEANDIWDKIYTLAKDGKLPCLKNVK